MSAYIFLFFWWMNTKSGFRILVVCRYFAILALGEIKMKVEVFWLQNLQPVSSSGASWRQNAFSKIRIRALLTKLDHRIPGLPSNATSPASLKIPRLRRWRLNKSTDLWGSRISVEKGLDALAAIQQHSSHELFFANTKQDRSRFEGL